MGNFKNKLALFIVWLDEKFEIIKSSKKKRIILAISSVIIAIVAISSLGGDTDISEEKSPVNDTEVSNVTKVYEVQNKEMYQKGIDYYYDTMRKTKELWEMQCGVPFYFNGFIEETAEEKSRTVSDTADYFYGGLIAVRDETKENLKDLQLNGENSQVIEYEKKILSFIETTIENYSIDYKISEKDRDEYLKWIENKCELLGEVQTDTEDKSDTETDTYSYSYGNVYLTIKYGEFVEAIENGDILVVKAKITPSYSNKATINQNNFNVEDIVKNQVGNKYKEIQYWAVADMTDGSESKVISFTINENVINSIANGSIPGNTIMDYATDVWILPSLLN